MSTNRTPPQRPNPFPQISEKRPDSTKATTQPVVAGGSELDRITKITTYLTQVGIPDPKLGTPILYNGDRTWAKVTLTLETAGPVAVGTDAVLEPIFSGKGQLLLTDVPMTFTIGKGSRIYVLATALNRIKVTIEPLPWLEQITANAAAIAAKLGG